MGERGVAANRITEQIGDEFGVTVRYDVQDCRVEFVAYEVLGVREGGVKLYTREGASSSIDDTENLDEAEPFIKGSVKWDGCSHFYFGDEGYLHLCGKAAIHKLSETLPVIYERCGALMKADGQNLLDGEFDVEPEKK